MKSIHYSIVPYNNRLEKNRASIKRRLVKKSVLHLKVEYCAGIKKYPVKIRELQDIQLSGAPRYTIKRAPRYTIKWKKSRFRTIYILVWLKGSFSFFFITYYRKTRMNIFANPIVCYFCVRWENKNMNSSLHLFV